LRAKESTITEGSFLLKYVDGVDTMHSNYVIPSTLNADYLRETASIFRACMKTPFSSDDHQVLKNKLVKTSKPRLKPSQVSSDSEDDSNNELFGQLENKAKSSGEDRKEKKKRKSNTRSDLDEEELARKQLQKKLKEEEKRRKIKSSLLIAESDEESDEERDRLFFESELKLRKAMETASINQMSAEDGGGMSSKVKGTGQNKRRKTAAASGRIRSQFSDDIDATRSSSDDSSTENNLNSGKEFK